MSFFNKERHFSLFNADSYHYSREHCLFKGKFDFLHEQGGGTLIRTGGTFFLVLSLGVQGVRLSGIGTHFFIKNPAGGTLLDGQVRL